MLELMKIFREEQRQVCFTLWLCVNELVLRDSRKRYNGPTLIDRCTDRQTDMCLDRQIDRWIEMDRFTFRQTDRQVYSHRFTDRQTDRCLDTQIDRWIEMDRFTFRQTDKQVHSHRFTDRQVFR